MKRTDFDHATRIEWIHGVNIRQLFARTDGQYDFLEFVGGELDTIRTGSAADMRKLGEDVARAAELAALPAEEYHAALTDQELTERLGQVDAELDEVVAEAAAALLASAEDYEDDICRLAIRADQLSEKWLPLNAERARRRAAA